LFILIQRQNIQLARNRIYFLINNAEQDTFEYVASILVNISKVEAGRRILMEPKRGLLKQIIRQFDSTNQLRKKGVSAA
jgi:hypothetical protein